MANYALRVIQNGQTKTAVLRDNQNGRIGATSNTEYQLYNENGELITHPLTERLGDDLLVFANGEKDDAPEFVLIDFFNKNPVLNADYVADAGHSLMTNDELSGIVSATVAESSWVKATTVGAAVAIGGTALALLSKHDNSGNHDWRVKEQRDENINTPNITINHIPNIDQTKAAEKYTLSGSLDNIDDDVVSVVVTVDVNGVSKMASVSADKKTWTLVVSGSELTNQAGNDLPVMVTVGVSDAAGNTASAAARVTYDVFVPDTIVTTPIITINDVPDISQSAVARQYTLSGSLKNIDADVVNTQVVININGENKLAVVSADKTTWSLVVMGDELAAKVGANLTVTATVTVRDAAGNTAHASDNDVYSVSAPAEPLNLPSITIDGIEPITQSNLNATTTFSGSLNLNNDELDNVEVTLTISNNVNGEVVTQKFDAVISSDKQSWSVADVPNQNLAKVQGDYFVEAVVEIARGNQTASAINTDTLLGNNNIDRFYVDTQIDMPNITINPIADIQQANVANKYTLSGTLSNINPDDVLAENVVVTVNINGVKHIATVSDNQNEWTLEISGSQLAHQVGERLPISATVQVTDDVGNQAQSMSDTTYNVIAKSVAPSIVIDKIAEDEIAAMNQALGATQTKTITGKLNDVPASVTPQLTVTVSGKAYAAKISGSTWSVDVPKSDLTVRGEKEVLAKLVLNGSSYDATAKFYVIDPYITIDPQTIHITQNNLNETTTLTGKYDVSGADSHKILLQIGTSDAQHTSMASVVKTYSSDDANNPVLLNAETKTWHITLNNRDLAFAVGNEDTLQVGATIEFTEDNQAGNQFTGMGYVSDLTAPTASFYIANLVDTPLPVMQYDVVKTTEIHGGEVVSGSDEVADTFVLNQILEGQVATIAHFDVNKDKIQLNSQVFTAVSNTMEHFADYIQYNSGTGILSYDADGLGMGSAIVVAHLDKNLPIEANHFVIG